MNQHTVKHIYKQIDKNIPMIKELLKKKTSLKDMVPLFGLSRDALCNYLDKIGIRKKRNNRKIKNDDSILEYAIKKCKEGNSIASVARKFNICSETLAKDLFQKYNYKPGHDGKKFCDSKYFKNINTKEKAYWLGFFSADGYVNQEKRNIEFCLKDEESVIGFKNAIKSQCKISCKADKYYRLNIKDKEMSEDLLALNLDNNKTYNYSIPFNKIPQNLISHFLRGYFDGDAYIGLNKTNNLKLSITEASSKVMNDLKYIIKKEINVDINIIFNKRNLYVFSVSGKKAKQILDYIYKDSNESIRLKRKYDKFKDYCRLKLNSKRKF